VLLFASVTVAPPAGESQVSVTVSFTVPPLLIFVGETTNDGGTNLIQKAGELHFSMRVLQLIRAAPEFLSLVRAYGNN
jgi:hypothetical protein